MRLKPYWELTYKEKFYRTLWLFPLILVIPFIPFIPEKMFEIVPKSIFFVILWLLLISDAIYNYKKWKKSN